MISRPAAYAVRRPPLGDPEGRKRPELPWSTAPHLKAIVDDRQGGGPCARSARDTEYH